MFNNNMPMPRYSQFPWRGPFKIIKSRSDHLTVHLRSLPSGKSTMDRMMQDVREKAGSREGVRRVDMFVSGQPYFTVIDGKPYEGASAPHPVQSVIVRGNSAVIEQCIYCGQQHIHGLSDRTDDDHRTAHCRGIQSSGYFLQPMEPMDDDRHM